MRDERGLTDSKSVCAEFPNTKENPSTTVARGTSDDSELFFLKINRQMKMIMSSATIKHTASSLATMELAS